ncbi:MAG TPA: aspartyl protease family protein [Candidatus Eisenbacteria bacterium]|nr:aspartyl protease family protein [Candidatus Eisenbacteria bacterium]
MRQCHPLLTTLLAATIGLAGAAPAARATITPEAAKVVERYLTAIGGRSGVDAEQTTHTRSTIQAFGFSGTLESWAQRPDKIASQTALGPFTLKDGFDGTTAWRIDQNGKLTMRDGKDLEDEKGSAWFENGQWLVPDQGGGSVTVQGTEKDSSGSWTVLEVKGPVGRGRSIWFNTRTGLIDRVVIKTDQQTVTTRVSDYRLDHGLLRSHRQEASVANMPLNNLMVTIDSIWVNEPIDPARFAPPAPAAADYRFLKGAGPAHLPMAYTERHVWLKASINGGPPEDFIVDTGASVSLLDSAWAATHGIVSEGKMQALGAGATGDVAFTKVSTIRVEGPGGDGIEIAGQKLAVLALNRWVAPFFWHDAAGVLGYDFISRFVVEIDYDRGVLTLHDPKTFKYAGKGTGVPITMAGGIPVVKAKLDGQYEGLFRLDVGSGSTVDLHSPFVKKHGLREQAKQAIAVMGGGFGGTFTSDVVRMKSMEIGPYKWTDPLVILSGAQSGGLASEEYAGNMGNEIFERFKCTLDYEHRMLYLEPGKRYGKVDRFSKAGVQLARYGDTIKAMQVLPGSAAAAAGIQEGDEVVSLNGKPILTWTQDRVTELMENGKDGEAHTLAIKRGGKPRKLTLKLKTMI